MDSVFSGVSLADLTVLSDTKTCRQYGRGETIFRDGDRPTGLFCINHGNIKLYKTTGEGKEQIVRLVRGGDILGYRSLISGGNYAAYATAMEDAHVCFIPRQFFFNLLSTDTSFSLRIMALLSQELRAAEDQVVEMAHKPARERLAEVLLMLEQKYGFVNDGVTLKIKLTREEIANMVGAATESVIRLLSSFKDEGMIDLQGRKLMITKHKALVNAANLSD